jgi:NAD(P)-dependent dehydrogenase (short-subunit alcohol dehydrogenase family)
MTILIHPTKNYMQSTPKNFQNKIVLITGGNVGIGLAIALAFAAQGATIIISARREDEGERALQKIKALGAEALFIKADMKDPAAIDALFSQIKQRFGRLDFAVNNAGISGSIDISSIDYPKTSWDDVMQINVTAVWLCMQHELKMMLAQKHGAIINMSSIACIQSGKAGIAYTASKHAVVGLTRYAAKEYAAQGIRVNALCPGLTETNMLSEINLPKDFSPASMIPMGRFARADEIAGAATWLCSEAASFITGIALPIDGGLHA